MNNIKIRKCIVCGKHRHKDELFRVVKNKSGEINIDFTGKLNGRGAYICKDKYCIDKTIKGKNLNRALKCNVPVEIYQKLEAM
ncbi:MAG: YlxR family protein [Helcococcus sp.]|nr:YlxR family protein [Helcococcus sp.]